MSQIISQVCLFLSLQDNEETADFAVDGLKQVMAVKSRVVLPYLVPKVQWETNFKLYIGAVSSACCQFSLDQYGERECIV